MKPLLLCRVIRAAVRESGRPNWNKTCLRCSTLRCSMLAIFFFFFRAQDFERPRGSRRALLLRTTPQLLTSPDALAFSVRW